MAEIVVRRRRADEERTVSEVSISVTDKRGTGMTLKGLFQEMQRERGRGLWSDADPEILVEGRLVGRLRRQETIEELANHVLERFYPLGEHR